MTISHELRWACISVYYIYGLQIFTISKFANCSERSIKNWLRMFLDTGNVAPKSTRDISSRWPSEVLSWVEGYVQENPCFYLIELKQELLLRFPDIKNVSIPTICRALRFDLGLSRKILTKRAREAKQHECDVYLEKLKKIYTRNDQLVFLDETSKDGRDSFRNYAWSRIGSPALVSLPFSRGNRISVLAAFDIGGFFAWNMDVGTYDREKFHKAMIEKVIFKMNPYPSARSILILDNAKIHMYQNLVNAVASVGAFVIFLPPYCPHLNPIEFGFAQLKKWIKKNANLVFPKFPEMVLTKAFADCTRPIGHLDNLFANCGYGTTNLIDSVFTLSNTNDDDNTMNELLIFYFLICLLCVNMIQIKNVFVYFPVILAQCFLKNISSRNVEGLSEHFNIEKCRDDCALFSKFHGNFYPFVICIIWNII